MIGFCIPHDSVEKSNLIIKKINPKFGMTTLTKEIVTIRYNYSLVNMLIV